MFVERHALQIENADDLLLRQIAVLEDTPRLVAAHAGNLVHVLTAAERALGLCGASMRQPVARLGAQAVVALWAVGAALGQRVVVRLGNGKLEVGVVDLDGERTAERWITGFHLACIAEDDRSLRSLVEIDVASIEADAANPYLRLWIDGLIGWAQQRPAWREALRSAIEALNARSSTLHPRARLLHAPAMRLPELMEGGEPDLFSAGVVDALQSHRAWYDRGGSRGDPQGGVAVLPWAYVTIARRRGLVADVRSEYLPDFGAPPSPAEEVGTEPGVDTRYQPLVQQARAMLRATRGASAEAFRPRSSDWSRVFTPMVADAFAAAYADVWRRTPRWDVDADRMRLEISACSSDDLARGTGSSAAFPGGYARLRGALQPGVVWLCWRWKRDTSDAGLAYDGLVRLDERWVWFPKPWRFQRA